MFALATLLGLLQVRFLRFLFSVLSTLAPLAPLASLAPRAFFMLTLTLTHFLLLLPAPIGSRRPHASRALVQLCLQRRRSMHHAMDS